MKAERFPVTAACAVVEVSTSAYYDWCASGRHSACERAARDAALLAEIRTIHRQHPDYGSPRVTGELARRGMPVNHKKVEAMMAAAGIVARRLKFPRSRGHGQGLAEQRRGDRLLFVADGPLHVQRGVASTLQDLVITAS